MLDVVAAGLLGVITGAHFGYVWAARRWWRRGFDDHREIVEKVWGADPMGWVDYARRRREAAQQANEEKGEKR